MIETLKVIVYCLEVMYKNLLMLIIITEHSCKYIEKNMNRQLYHYARLSAI